MLDEATVRGLIDCIFIIENIIECLSYMYVCDYCAFCCSKYQLKSFDQGIVFLKTLKPVYHRTNVASAKASLTDGWKTKVSPTVDRTVPEIHEKGQISL